MQVKTYVPTVRQKEGFGEIEVEFNLVMSIRENIVTNCDFVTITIHNLAAFVLSYNKLCFKKAPAVAISNLKRKLFICRILL